jgi:alkylation response protein AidB-like acyl-CoA dehydrogenase
MDFVLNDDQLALQGELRRFLADRLDGEARRGGLDRSLWAELGGMGVFALTLPESGGGVGLGTAEAVVVFEELGRAIVPGPLVATCLAAGLVEDAESGEAVVGAIERTPPFVIEHAVGLDSLLVLDGDTVTAVEPPPATPVERPLDPLTPVAFVDALPGGTVLDVSATSLRKRAALLIAAFQVGLGQAAVDLGVSHALDREQFGRTIGSFQAVKHQLADATVAVEVARAGVHAAAVAADDLDAGASRGAAVARIVASHAADRAARTCIQVHGGMGFTWELDAHLLLKRSMVLDRSFGGVEASVEAYAHAL